MRFHEVDAVMPGQLDFVPRARRKGAWRVTIAFVTTILLVLALAYVPIVRGMTIYNHLLVVLLITILFLYVSYRNQLNLDLVMSAEYQNLIFAQALNLGCDFCILVRRDGTIIYTNEGLSTVFPHFDYSQSQALEGVFEQGVVRLTDRERIMTAIYNGASEHLIFPIFNQPEDKTDYIITVEPLARPSGFSIIRGRQYLGQRAGVQMMPDMLRSTSIEKIDHLLTHTDSAHYVADAYGQLEYANHAFATLLGYDPETILLHKLQVKEVFQSMGTTRISDDYTIGDYAGEAVLSPKNAARVACHVTQSVLRDEQGKTMGATGSIQVVQRYDDAE